MVTMKKMPAPEISKRKNWKQESADTFDKLAKEARAKATKHECKWGKEDGDAITWEIAKEGEVWKGADVTPTTSSPLKIDIPIKENAKQMTNEEAQGEGSHCDNFFKCSFPSVEGHGKIIDKCNETCSNCRDTVNNRKIKLHDPDAADPDHKVNQCYALLIAGATSVHRGIEALWETGDSIGLTPHPDFGKFISKEEMKVFCAAAPCAWCNDEKAWAAAKDGFPGWDVFLPLLYKSSMTSAETSLPSHCCCSTKP